MQKEVSPPFQCFSAAAGNQTMTGTNTIISLPSTVLYRDTVAYQLQWTGSPTGTFGVQVSSDYNPGLPQSAGTQNNGIWTDVTLAPIPTTSGVSSGTINLSQLGSGYVRCYYTNTTGTGVLTGYFTAKSLG